MVCVSWLLAVMAVMCVLSPRVGGQCWISPECRDLSSDNRILECIHQCRSLLQAESSEPGSAEQQSTKESLSLGILLSTLASREKSLEAETDSEPRSKERRSYSMEHFRWGKPAGRKRRPVKVYTSALEGDVQLEARRQLAGVEDGKQRSSLLGLQTKKDGTYQMGHFRWGNPPAAKRYGGFMRPWAGQSHKPLLTLFKNVIVKDGA